MNGTLQEALRRATRAARPLALRSAGKDRSNTAIVVHAGRRTGRTYRTPVVAAREQDGFVIAIPYGERTDWAKNVLAKGSASLITGGQTYEVDRPEVVPLADVSSSFRPKEQRLQKRFRVATALQVHLA